MAAAGIQYLKAENIEPERQKEIEAGLDAVMFGERVSFEITGFQKNITNLLLEREVNRF